MKTHWFIVKLVALCTFLSLYTVVNAQNNLPLVAETDFSVSGGDRDYWHTLDMVDGFGKSAILPDRKVGTAFKTPKSTDATPTTSVFMDARSYSVTPNPIRLDSLRFADMGTGKNESSVSSDWGIVFSAGKTDITQKQLMLSLSVYGLKNGGRYRVEVEYCNPLSSAYLNTNGNAPKPHLSGGYRSAIKVGVNDLSDGYDASFNNIIGNCATTTVTQPTNPDGDNRAKHITDNKLTVDIYYSQAAAGEAVMIRSIKIYAELEPIVVGEESVCAGGESTVLSVNRTYTGSTIQWYKKNGKSPNNSGGTAISGETGTTCLHISTEKDLADENDYVETTYYYVVTTPDGKQTASSVFVVKDVLCCKNDAGGSQSRKLIWQDDFGTFSNSGTSYDVWNYKDITNPEIETKTTKYKWKACLDYDIPGAICAADQTGTSWKGKDGGTEGWYFVVANISDQTGTSELGWASQTGDGKYPRDRNQKFFPDHTYPDGSKYGACLLLNCGNNSGDIIYDRTITGLCQKKLTVKCWINNFSKSEHDVAVQLVLEDPNDPTNIVKSGVVTRNAQGNSGVDWREISASIMLSGTDLVFKVLSIGGNGYKGIALYNDDGNDLLLDDIRVYACANPTANIYFNLDEKTEKETSCTAEDIKLYVLETPMMRNLGGTPYFVYQYSLTPENKKSWVTIQGPVEDLICPDVAKIVDELTKKKEIGEGSKIYFRCVLGLKDDLLDYADYYNPDLPCSPFSVSDAIELTIECPKCSEYEKPVITSSFSKFDSKNKIINLCKGESATLSAGDMTGKDKDGAAYSDYKIQWIENAGSSDKVLLSVPSASSINDLEVSWDNNQPSVEYILTIKDNFSEQCELKSDTVLVISNPQPEVSDLTVAPFCEGSVDWLTNFNEAIKDIDQTKYTLKWYSDEDLTSPVTGGSPNMSSEKAGTYTYYYQLTDKTTNCPSEAGSLKFTIEAIPAPLSVQDVQYLKSGDMEPVLVHKSSAVDGVVTGAEVLWTTISESELKTSADSLAATIIANGPTPTIKDKDNTDDEFYYTWVYQRVQIAPNVYCASSMKEIKISILGAPAPDVTSAKYCKNESGVKELSSYAEVNQPDPANPKNYELLFYASETATTTLDPTTIPDVSTAGLTTYYVSQREVGTVNESKRIPFNIEVYDVAELTTATSIDYCVKETTVPLSAVSNPTAGYVQEATGFYWADATTEISNSTVTVAPQPTTTVAGVQSFNVQPYYAISATQICRGTVTPITVNVYETAAPTPATIQYIKADADANNVFPALTTKPTWEEETGYTYYYSAVSESDVMPQPVSDMLYSSVVPTPQYDVSLLSGGTKNLYCWVYRVDNSNPKACNSEPVMLTIKISDALPPAVKNVYVCEGSPVPDLQAEVQLLPGSTKTAAEYDLYWYGTTDPNTNPNAQPVQKSGNTYSTGITSAVSVDHAKTEYKYYVTQIDKNTGAESSSSEIIVTVLPKPILDIKPLDPTCEKKIDISTAVTVVNAAECGTVSFVYTDGSGKELTSTEIAATDIYKVTPSYAVSYSGDVIIADASCTGLTYDINAEVDSMDVPTITGPTQACPGESGVQIEASVEHSTFASSDIRYKWSDQQSITGGANSLNTFPDEPGKVFTYTVTAYAGVCEKTSEEHTITVGDGQVKGSMTVTEDGNQLVQGPFVDVVNREFYSCGGDVTINVDYEKTEGDYEWYKNGQATGVTGPNYKITSTTAVSHDIYEVRFVNKCDASASITVHTIPLTVTPETGAEQKCEKESFSTSLNIVCSETPVIQWMLNGIDIPGANAAIYSKSNLKEEEDDGQYSYIVTNRGCVAKDNSKSLDVQKYIEMEDLKDPIIVARGEDQTIQLIMNVPSTQTVKTVDWQENNVSVQNSSSISYTEHSVVADHEYTIYLSDPDYCKTSTTATIWVDAELQLTTTLKDTICLGLSTILEIDTTGTGRFRQAGVTPQLKVVRSTGGEVMDVTSELKKVGDKLQMEVSPTEKAVYTITFDYGSQHKESIEEVYVIEAISLTLPDSPTLCEGESVDLTVTDVLPEGTTVSWEADPTITSSAEGETVTVEPAYTGGTSHSSTYTYTAIAYNAKCNDSKRYEIPVYVDEALKGEIQGSEVICEGDQGRIDASSYDAASYVWNVDTVVVGTGSALSVYPRTTTTYELKMERGTCKAEDSYELKVTSLPVITSVDSIGVRDRSIETEKGKGTGTFYYWVDVEAAIATDNEVYNLTFGKHVAYVRDENGCKTSMPFVMEAPEPEIPEWFSPNGDGINDGWVIGKLAEVYPDAKIWIYDRFGKLMIELKGSDTQGWDGTYEGTPMPSTDYWYVVDIEEIDRQYTGHFTLIRQ